MIILFNNESLLRSESNIVIKPSFELFVHHVIFDHTINFKFFLENEKIIWIKLSFEVFICYAFFDHTTNKKSLVRIDQNILIRSSFEVFVCHVNFYEPNNSQSLLRMARKFVWSLPLTLSFSMWSSTIIRAPSVGLEVTRNICIKPSSFEIFIHQVMCYHTIHPKSFLQSEQNIWIKHSFQMFMFRNTFDRITKLF